MLKAIDVANFFIYLLSDKEDEENDLTNMKLNKLTYYAQGQFLKTNGKPLFSRRYRGMDTRSSSPFGLLRI